MKNIIIYNLIILLFAAVSIFNGCDSPAPTELVQGNSSSQAPIQIQVASKDTSDGLYNNGFDTTGVAVSDTAYASIIYVVGTKITFNSYTEKISSAQALFLDKKSPVRGLNGRIIGYHTILPGDIQFDYHHARLIPFRVRYHYLGHFIDTLLGDRYILSSRMFNPMYRFNFPYNSSIKFQISTTFGKSIDFDIATPPEVVGKVKLTGRLKDKTLAAELNWNSAYQKHIDIILGVIARNQKNPIPLFKITGNDSGKLIIPDKLLNSIPSNKYDKIVFSFVRAYTATKNADGNNILVSSQSIHSIILDIP